MTVISVGSTKAELTSEERAKKNEADRLRRAAKHVVAQADMQASNDDSMAVKWLSIEHLVVMLPPVPI